MLTTKTIKAAAKPVAVTLLIGASLVCPAQATRAAFMGMPSAMQSTATCTYSLRLQNSAQAKQLYIAQLSAALGGGTQVASNDPTSMYGSIQKASYTTQDNDSGSDVNVWGFDSKQAVAPAGLDSFSTECLGCHDGVEAQEVTADIRDNPFDKNNMHMPKNDHPIGMDYTRYVASGQHFKPVWGNSKMVFIGGKVGCLTCHDPLNPERGHLVASNQRSSLCLTCHDY